jgi:oligogalacturonide transporter
LPWAACSPRCSSRRFLYAFSWERQRPESARVATARPSLWRNLSSTLRIRAFRLHLGMYLGGYISQDIFNAAFTFFVIFALAGSTQVASALLGTMYIVQLVAVLIAIRMALRATPAVAYRIAALSFAAGVAALVLLWWAGLPATSGWIWIGMGLVGLGRGALNYIPWATYNYMADVDEIVTGRRREGAFAGVMTFIRKATQAAAVALVGLLMDWGGFVPRPMCRAMARADRGGGDGAGHMGDAGHGGGDLAPLPPQPRDAWRADGRDRASARRSP